MIFAGAISAMIMRNSSPFASPVEFTLMVAALGAILVFTLKNWRCPACERDLGKGAFPRFCPQCGVPLAG